MANQSLIRVHLYNSVLELDYFFDIVPRQYANSTLSDSDIQGIASACESAAQSATGDSRYVLWDISVQTTDGYSVTLP